MDACLRRDKIPRLMFGKGLSPPQAVSLCLVPIVFGICLVHLDVVMPFIKGPHEQQILSAGIDCSPLATMQLLHLKSGA